MNHRLPLLIAAVVLAAVPLAAHADVSANVTLISKYKFRGQDQADPSTYAVPAIQGGFDYTNRGFYLGNWNSSVGYASGTEMDLYGGYRGEIAGHGYDVGVLHYHYPGSSSTFDTTELYAGIAFGPVSAKYSHTVSSKYFGVAGGRGTGYLELNAGFEVASGVKLVAHVGTTQYDDDAQRNGGVDYTDYKVGFDVDLGSGFTAGFAVAGASKRSVYGDLNKSRALLSISKSL